MQESGDTGSIEIRAQGKQAMARSQMQIAPISTGAHAAID
jgi:hypothetical protein